MQINKHILDLRPASICILVNACIGLHWAPRGNADKFSVLKEKHCVLLRILGLNLKSHTYWNANYNHCKSHLERFLEQISLRSDMSVVMKTEVQRKRPKYELWKTIQLLLQPFSSESGHKSSTHIVVCGWLCARYGQSVGSHPAIFEWCRVDFHLEFVVEFSLVT